MTIKEEETTKPISIKKFISNHSLIISVSVIIGLCLSLVYYVENKNSVKWTKIVDNHPAIKIERRGESNLLTSNYTVVSIDGVYHVSVPSSTDEGSSYSYEIQDIKIYEVIK